MAACAYSSDSRPHKALAFLWFCRRRHTRRTAKFILAGNRQKRTMPYRT